MKLIRDIRLMESNEPNEVNHATPYYIGKIYHYDHMDTLEVIERLVFYLRSKGFGFEGFDHLYLNFTTVLPHGEIRKNYRPEIREFSWFRYVDIGCDAERFNTWENAQKVKFILDTLRGALEVMTEGDMRELALASFEEVVHSGEGLEIPYKQKKNENYRIDILIKITDELDYIPVVEIREREGAIVLRQELKPYVRDAFICQFGSFSIGKKSLRISPRKRYESEYYELKPIKFTW